MIDEFHIMQKRCAFSAIAVISACAIAWAWSGSSSASRVVERWDALGKGASLVDARLEQPSGVTVARKPALRRAGVVESLPWSEDFSNPEAAREAFTIVDANRDGRSWNIIEGKAHSIYHLENAADDWLFTPGLPVEEGKTYRLKFETYCSTGYAERLEVKVGNAPEVVAMTTTLAGPTDIPWGDADVRRFQSVDFTAPATGTVYVGFHAVSDANKNQLSLASIEFLDVATIPPEPVYVTCYAEDFSSVETARSQFTVIDANRDDKTWIFESGRACYDYSSDNVADDWLITPAVALTRGKTYTLRFEIYARSTTWPEELTIKAGSSPTAGAMTATLVPTTEIVWTDKDKRRFIEAEYTPAATAPVYIGFHVTSPANRYNLYVADIKVLQEVADAPPAAVSDLVVTPEPTGNLTARIDFKAPSQTADGQPLAALDRVEVKRNGVVVKTFSPVTPGADCSFTDNVPGPGDYRYDITPFSATDPGDVATVNVYVGPNVTNPPTNVNLVESATDPGMVTMTWTAPTTDVDGNPVNQANVTYFILEYDDGAFIPVADGLTGTSHTFRAIAAGSQEFKTFVVTAVTARGRSYPGVTPTVAVGEPYELPVKMSFTEEDIAGCCIATYVQRANCDWNILLDNSGLVSQDRDDASMTFSGDSAGDKGELWLGKINIPADAVNPVLSYWVYKVEADDDNFCSAYVLVDGQEVMLETTPIEQLENVGWNHVVAPLPAAALGKTVHVVMCAELETYTVVSIDNISVFQMLARDLVVGNLRVPALVSPDMEAEGWFVVDNLGIDPVKADEYAVKLYRNDELVKTFPTTDMRPGAQARFSFAEAFSVCDAEWQHYRVQLDCDGDLDMANNKAEASLRVLLPEYPVPTSLKGVPDGDMLQLSWEAPDLTQGESETVTEGFEDAESFTSRVEGWTFVDEDGHDTGDFVEHPVPGLGEGVKSSFFVFDIPGMFDGAEAWYSAHGGDKFLASFFITDDDVEKSDWAISPMLSGAAQTISFWAKSYSSYRAESIEVLASSAGTVLNDFTPIAEASGLMRIDAVPGQWTRYEYRIAEGTRYFAIRSCGKKTFLLKIDDVTFEKAPLGATLTLNGYNVYRDSQRLNTQPLAVRTYIDAEASAHSGATYKVTAVYDRGESRVSDGYVSGGSAIGEVEGVPAMAVCATIGGITVTGATDVVNVYSTDARLVAKVTATGAPVDIPLVPGLYLVASGGHACKVVVR